MSNSFFQFKQFVINQDKCAMKVTTDACLFGAWVAMEISQRLSLSMGTAGISMLDIGAGTGLLSLMICQKVTSAKIDAIEIDEEAFRQAAENIAGSPYASQINNLLGDAQKLTGEKKYRFIVSNPPFYANDLRPAESKKSIAHHDDFLPLRELVTILRNNLEPTSGEFFMLLPYKRKAEVQLLLESNHLFCTKMVSVRPAADLPYFRIMVTGSAKSGIQLNESEIVVKDNSTQYTSAFTTLLKDYYLHL